MIFHATAAVAPARPNFLFTFRNHLLCSVCTAMLLAGSGGMVWADEPNTSALSTPAPKVSKTVEAGKTLAISEGDKVDEVVINKDGTLSVAEKGTADTVNVNDGGYAKTAGKIGTATVTGKDSQLGVLAGGTADDVSMSDGGYVMNEGKITKTTVNDGGKLDVKTGGKADDVTVNGVTGWKRTTVGVGGSAFVSGKGSEIKTGTVNNGGLLKVADGGTVDNVAVKTGGKLDVQAEGKVNNVVVEGEANYKRGIGWISGLAGYVDVFGQISKSTVSKGGWLTVLSGGKIGDIVASDGGRLVVEAGGKVTNVTIDASMGLIIGEITGKSTINSGGVLNINSGGIAGEIVLNGGDSDANIDKAGAAVAGTAGDITINRNGALNGIGTVGNVFVHAGGTISSGAGNDPTGKSGAGNNVVGTLTATGDVTFDKGSFLGMQIANDGSSNSKLAVKGQANLLGGTVNVYSEDIDKTTRARRMLSEKQVKDFFVKEPFVILTAVKGVKGKFDDIVPHYNYITPLLSYTDNEVRVRFDLTETAKTERAKAEEKRIADAKLAEQKQQEADAKAAELAKATADAKASEEKRIADAKVAEETRMADAKAAEQAKATAEAKAAEEKRIADAKLAEQKQQEADAKAAELAKATADAKASEEKRIADAKTAEEKAKQEAAALAEAERLKIVALEEQVKHLVLVDAVTPNQKSTGHAVMQLGLGNRLLQTVLFSQKGEVLHYDTLSGEAHASLRGTLLQDAGLVSGAASERVRAAFDGVGAKAAPDTTPLAYGPEAKDKRNAGEAFAAATPAPAAATTALWGQAYGGWSHGASDGNAAAYNRNTGGIVTGIDALIAGTWRLGVLAGYGSTSLHGAGSSVSADSYQVGIYGGTKIDALTLSLGTILAHHVIDTRRTVSFGTLEETDTAGYSANTVQLFGEAAYRIETPYAALEPFAAAAYTHLKTAGFTETGGIAALSAPSSSTDLTTTTLGLRASRVFTLGNATTLTARGMAGWRHAYGDVTPQAQLAFASGGESFDVSGLPIAQDAALVEAGLAFDIGRATTLGLTYTGQFSAGVNDNSVKADLTVRF